MPTPVADGPHISVAQLSQAVRLTVTGSPDPPFLAILTRHLAVAEARIERYAEDAPDDLVKDEAAVRFVGYLLDAPPVAATGSTARGSDAFSNSGAKALLNRTGTHRQARGWRNA